MINITVSDVNARTAGFFLYVDRPSTTPTCASCGVESSLLHTCGQCESCCVCMACSKCQQYKPISYCNLCQACPDCCTCPFCPLCRRVVSGALCSECRGCAACCPGPSKPHEQVFFVRNPVDLNRFIPTKKDLKHNPSPRLLSAEIETCGYRHGRIKGLNKVITEWGSSVVHDGSLPDGGFEINTHPSGGDLWMKQCSELYTAMSAGGVKFNASAGCHIHVDARDLGYIQIANMLRLYYYTENALYLLIAKERRGNHFCARCASGYMIALNRISKALTRAKDDTQRAVIYRQAILNELYKNKALLTKAVPKTFITDIRRDKGSGPRYRGLNLHSWIHRGTVEFRFPGHQPSAHDLQMMGIMLANFLDLSKRPEEEILELLEPYRLPYEQGLEQDRLNALSLELLVKLSPLPAVSDWIRERVKFYNNQVGAFLTQL